MDKKQILLVLNTIAQNPDVELENLYNEIEDKISWKNLLKVFSELHEQEYILRGIGALNATITPLGENIINDIEEEINLENKIQRLTIRELEGNVFHVKKWWLIVLINFIISILTGILLLLLNNK